MVFLNFLLNNPITRAIGVALAALAAVLAYGAAKKREGRQGALQRAESEDIKRAEQARKAGADALAKDHSELNDDELVDRVRKLRDRK